MTFWRAFNPLARSLAGVAPWWVVLETTGRLKLRGKWHAGTAALEPFDPAVVSGFGHYARMGPRTLGIEPKLVRVDLDAQTSA